LARGSIPNHDLADKNYNYFIPGKEYSDNSDEAIKDCISETGR